jgi:hypothetical protein
MMRYVGRLAAILFLIVGFAASAGAHQTNISTTRIVPENDRVYRVDVAMLGTDLSRILADTVAQAAAGTTNDTAYNDALREAASKFILSHVSVEGTNGGGCTGSAFSVLPDGDGVRVSTRWDCRQVEGGIVYRTLPLLQAVGSAARQVVLIGPGSDARQSLLDASDPSLDLPPGPLPSPEQAAAGANAAGAKAPETAAPPQPTAPTGPTAEAGPNAEQASAPPNVAEPAAPAAVPSRSQQTLIQAMLRYMQFGIEHILTGYDHIAFLLAVLLWSRKAWPVIKIVTAFTVSHSVTLSLAVLPSTSQIFAIPPSVTEPAIALTIIYVALENFFNFDVGKRWRDTFLFGFVHGFGFASGLKELGLPENAIVPALASFNIGVEIGQIGVVLLVMPVLLLIDRFSSGVRSAKLVYGGSGIIAALAAWWFVARVFL